MKHNNMIFLKNGERTIRLGSIVLAIIMILIITKSFMITAISAKAAYSPTVYNIGDEVQVNSDGWSVRTAPSYSAPIAFMIEDEEIFSIKSVEEQFWYEITYNNMSNIYIQIPSGYENYFTLYKDANEIISTTIPQMTPTTLINTTTTNNSTVTTTTVTSSIANTNTLQVGSKIKFLANAWYYFENPDDEIEIGDLKHNEEFMVADTNQAPWYYIQRENGNNVWVYITEYSFNQHFSYVSATPSTQTSISTTESTTTTTTTVTTNVNSTVKKFEKGDKIQYYGNYLALYKTMDITNQADELGYNGSIYTIISVEDNFFYYLYTESGELYYSPIREYLAESGFKVISKGNDVEAILGNLNKSENDNDNVIDVNPVFTYSNAKRGDVLRFIGMSYEKHAFANKTSLLGYLGYLDRIIIIHVSPLDNMYVIRDDRTGYVSYIKIPNSTEGYFVRERRLPENTLKEMGI